jgi:hypothetical protein
MASRWWWRWGAYRRSWASSGPASWQQRGDGAPIQKIGWEAIAEMQFGGVSGTILDDKLPGGPVERAITYQVPFDRCNWMGNYRRVWGVFERRGSSA